MKKLCQKSYENIAKALLAEGLSDMQVIDVLDYIDQRIEKRSKKAGDYGEVQDKSLSYEKRLAD